MTPRAALAGVPSLLDGVRLEERGDGLVRVKLTLPRGTGFFERLRPPEIERSYELDEFGSFVIRLVDGKRTVLDVVDAFEQRFRMSRREVELSVVAFFKLLMQRRVAAVVVPRRRTAPPAAGVPTALLLAACVGLAGGAARADEGAGGALAALRGLCEAQGPRTPGAPGNLALEAQVADRFRQSGYSTGAIRFDAPVLEPGTLTLDCGPDGRFALDAMHPTLMRPGNFRQDAFDTRLVYLGRGDTEGLEGARGVALDGAIAVLDYEDEDRWLDLLRFGVEGVVFIGSGGYTYRQAETKVFNSEVSVPRFFIDGAAGERLRALCRERREVAARATAVPSRWRPGELRDLWVLVPGSDEILSRQVVVLTAALDANAVVPARAYGAQRAVNLQILLSLLDDLKTHPPRYSVLLVAVNAHTQRYAGERMLAWHLLADESRVEALRDEIAGEMRLARLYHREYGKLQLRPVAESDKADLPVMMEILWQLDAVQQPLRRAEHEQALAARDAELKRRRDAGEDVAALEEAPLPKLDEVLDLSAFDETAVRAAIDRARKALRDAYSGFFAARGRDPAELAREKQEDLAAIDALRALPFDAFMAKARRVKDVFDDEKLFESWRSKLDESTGRRVYVKGKLQDEFKAGVNRTAQQLMLLASGKRGPSEEAGRAARIAELKARRDDLRRVLVLFNKIDIGVGRTRTYYRQIAVNDTQRRMLKEAAEAYVAKYAHWETIHRRTLERDVANGALRRAVGTRKVALVVPLELDGNGRRYGFSWSAPGSKPDGFDGFGKRCTEIADALETDAQGPNACRYVDAVSAATDRSPQHFFALPESAVFYFHAADQTPALALKSVFAGRGKLFGPGDTVDQLDPARVQALQASVRRFFGAVLTHPEVFSAKNLEPVAIKGHFLWALQARTYAMEHFTGRPIPTTDVPGSTVMLYERGPSAGVRPSLVDGDVVNGFMAISDDTANAYFRGLGETARLAPLAYRLDPGARTIRYALDKGLVQSSKQINSNVQRSDRVTLPMFECREFVVKDRTDPTLLSAADPTVRGYWPKTGDGKSNPVKYGVYGADCLSPAWTHTASGPVAVCLEHKEEGVVEDTLMLITDHKRCVLNATPEEPDGKGFASQEALGPDFFRRAAHDMALLNRSRADEMKGVVNQLMDEFLDSGDRLNAEAEARRAEHDHRAYLAHNREALGAEVKAYGEIQQMTADMLKAVVVYMALMLPFCFFVQKLLFNFTRLEHELAGFSVLFVGMYALFRFIHPAFHIAMSPEAIFIAFVLGAIGCFTTAVLHSRFRAEMTILLRGIGGIGETAAYSTVGQTAMLIGVQNMRRRRIRTTLTTATIVLVVFTMLAFSSVSRKAKPTLIRKADEALYTGLFYHWPGGAPMDERSARVIADLFAGRAEVQTRWLLKETEPWRMERVSDPEVAIEIEAVSGLPPGDLALHDAMALVEGQDFSSPRAEEVLLPVSAADALGISAQDVGSARVRLLGRNLLVRGLLNDERYRVARDLNPNLPLVPMAAPARQARRQGQESLEMEDREVVERMMDTARLAILPAGLAAELGARPNAVSVLLGPESDLGAEIGRVLKITEAKFYIGSRAPFSLTPDAAAPAKAGTYYVGSSYRTAIGGLARLIIPLIIAGSIILNTMLGTVYERRSEIAVFNAIGLNPTHIFMFFLAEAIVYSFIGSVGGYLIGQLLTVALKSAGIIHDVNVNFSSLMVVYAILFTMGLVVLSTIYPGYVATRTAVPSGKRKWSMPPREGDRMSVIFPFIYRPRLAFGAMSYLRDFFEPLSEQSSGDLLARLEQTDEAEDAAGRPVLSLRYALALAPYDLGVTQQVTFTARYDEVVDSYRMHLDIERVSGRDTNWLTTNRPFLERMRKYLIRWRNIDPTRQAWYVERAAELFKTPPPEA